MLLVPRLRRATSLLALLVLLVAATAGGRAAASSARPAAVDPSAPSAAALAKIEPGLLDRLDHQEASGFVIEFDADADLGAAREVEDWTDRGRAVVAALRATAEASQADAIAELEATGATYQSFWVDNTLHVESGARSLALQLAAEDDVTRVRAPDTVPLEPTTPAQRHALSAGVEWGIADIHADQVWQQFGVRGDGLVVASIDSGVEFGHPALVHSYRGTNADGTFAHDHNWWDPTGRCTPGQGPCDNAGHGTHTMGTMVGDGGEGNRIGVAPTAQWIAAKGCESDTCSELALTSAAQWILAPTDLTGADADPSLRPHIVNNSWGGTSTGDDWFHDFIDAWTASGIFPVFANGNAGPACATSGAPGEYAAAYSVGNYAANGTIADRSSRGPGTGDVTKPDLAAPGTSVRSSVPGGGYGVLSGTSMAAPHLSGTIALLWSAAPSLVGDIDATRQLLDDTARDHADGQCGGDADDNNVYGEGRLDALAVVEAAPRGPTGRLSGQVVEAASGDPVAGARITLTGPSERSAVTGADGRYGLTLTPGDYKLVVTRFEYDDVEQTVRIRAGDSIVRDAQLTLSPKVVLRGHVSDVSGQGWPLYAHVELTGTPLQTFTDPATGDYRLVVPGGHSYSVGVNAAYPGYQPLTDSVRVQGSTRHDVGLSADVATCTAPGYARTGGLQEAFDGDPAPSGWTVVDHHDAGVAWRFDDPGERGNRTGGGGGFATVDSVDQEDQLPDTSLVSPAVDLSDAAHPVLEFATALKTMFPSKAAVELSVDGGVTWTAAWSAQADVAGPQTLRIPLPAAAGAADARIRFHYQRGLSGWWWQVDDVYLGDETCAPTPSGLVVGHTRSSLTGRPLDGVEVAADGPAPGPTTSRATPEDDHLRDGFYWLVTTPGRHRLTATMPEYADGTARPRVESGQVVEVDLGLASGRLTVAPRTVRVELAQGEQATKQITVINSGDAAATFSLEEVEGAPPSSAPRASSTAGTPDVQRVPTEVSPLPDRGDPQAATPSSPAPSAESGAWRDLAAYPFPVRDTAAGNLHGTVYSFGGYSAVERKAMTDSFRYDGTADEWVPIADLPQPRQQPAGAFVDGRFVVAGGWGADEHPVAETVIYDPASDSWSTAAANPTPLAASGTAVLDGALYVVGGCLDNDCGRTDVLRFDPEADTWTRLADYPQNTAWTSCGGIRGKVYCAGGIGTDADQFAVFGYDPETDAWTRVADLPLDMWASAYSVVDDHLVVVGGAAVDSSMVTNEGFAYDAVSDSWSALPPSNYAFLRASGACGFVKIGGKFEAWDGFANVEQLPGYDDCRSSTDVPWVRATPDHARVGPDHTARVRLRLDARHLEPGVHLVWLRVREDTPYDVPDVRIRLVVRGTS